MTLENCYKWLECFKEQGRDAEAEDMQRNIDNKISILEARGLPVDKPKEEPKSKGKK